MKEYDNNEKELNNEELEQISGGRIYGYIFFNGDYDLTEQGKKIEEEKKQKDM